MSIESQPLTKRLIPVAVLSLALGACSHEQGSADADSTPKQSSTTARHTIGYDVSFPQGEKHVPLPNVRAFGIVGLNATLANNFNPYLKQQIAWAKDSKKQAATYVHVGNPGSQQASVWPKSGTNKYGSCNGSDKLACDYEYGAYLANQDITYAKTYQADTLPVWLDVEPNYSWQTDTRRNVAAMEGMVETFQKHGAKVGIYSNADIWQRIAGSELPNTSSLKGLPDWVLGANTLARAQEYCTQAGWTGKMALAQAADNVHIDRDITCS